jgi:hypothetical protein
MPSNITRGNIEGLIALQAKATPNAVGGYTSAEQDFYVPGVLASDVVISLSPPSGTNGIFIGNVRVKSNNIISVIFVNSTATSATPASGNYTMTLGRLSDSSTLPIVLF